MKRPSEYPNLKGWEIGSYYVTCCPLVGCDQRLEKQLCNWTHSLAPLQQPEEHTSLSCRTRRDTQKKASSHRSWPPGNLRRCKDNGLTRAQPRLSDERQHVWSKSRPTAGAPWHTISLVLDSNRTQHIRQRNFSLKKQKYHDGQQMMKETLITWIYVL